MKALKIGNDVKIEYHNDSPYKLVKHGTTLCYANQVWTNLETIYREKIERINKI